MANVPCATCGKDTLHVALKCTVCGTVTVTNNTLLYSRLHAEAKTKTTTLKHQRYRVLLIKQAIARRVEHERNKFKKATGQRRCDMPYTHIEERNARYAHKDANSLRGPLSERSLKELQTQKEKP